MNEKLEEIFNATVAPIFNEKNYPNYFPKLSDDDITGFSGSELENFVPNILKIIEEDGGMQAVCNFTSVDYYDGSQFLFIFVFSWIKDGKLCTYKNYLLTEY